MLFCVGAKLDHPVREEYRLALEKMCSDDCLNLIGWRKSHKELHDILLLIMYYLSGRIEEVGMGGKQQHAQET
jgi:hypothetical protein